MTRRFLFLAFSLFALLGIVAPATAMDSTPSASCGTPASNQMSCSMPGMTGTPSATGSMNGMSTSNGAFYMTITNKGKEADRLVSVSSDIASAVEIHDMKMNGSQMEMFMLKDPVEIPAGKSIEFKPKHMHVMLIGIKKSLNVGDSFDVTLHFEKAGDVKVTVPVTTGTAPDAAKPVTAGDLEVTGVWARQAPKLDTGATPESTPASTPKA